jgi:hypothetical protein
MQDHGPKKSPNHGAEDEHWQKCNEHAYLGRPPFVGIGVFKDMPYLIDWQSKGDEQSVRDTSGRHKGTLMPRGPKGEKRPADVVGNAIHVMRIATGEIEENQHNAAAVARGKSGGTRRAAKLTAEQRSEIAKVAAQARWKKSS